MKLGSYVMYRHKNLSLPVLGEISNRYLGINGTQCCGEERKKYSITTSGGKDGLQGSIVRGEEDQEIITTSASYCFLLLKLIILIL